MRNAAVILLISVLMLSGCEEFLQRGPQSTIGDSMVVTIDGDGKFPEFLVGRWRANRNNWEFLFNPDGSLAWVFTNTGRATLTPGTTVVVPTRGKGEATLTSGKWFVDFSNEQNELIVEINMDEVLFEIGEVMIFGSISDRFVGFVSEDSDEWHVDWTSNPDYVVKERDQESIPMKATEEYKVIFTKIPDDGEEAGHHH